MSKAYLQERNSLMAQIGPALHDPTVASFRTSSGKLCCRICGVCVDHVCHALCTDV